MDADCYHVNNSDINGQVSQTGQTLQHLQSVSGIETNSLK